MKRVFVTRIRPAAIVIAAAALAISGVIMGPSVGAQALSGTQFNAGFIISNANFFDYNSMSAAAIQSFLQTMEPTCAPVAGVPCLKNYTATTTTRAAAANGCAAYAGAANEPASTIIYKVAQACQISPKVILVTLQKEEGLVLSKSPSAGAYNIAMGYGCPDTSSCDTTYYGFYNQVYSAAWQFRQYTYLPAGRSYQVGVVAVRYSPNAACGSSAVNIQDQATANLYLYTPYQPDQAALNNLGGTGDACSSYGNRNFWVYYWTWFGDPTGNSGPYGAFDAATAIPGGVTFSGWAIDPDTTSPINVTVSVDGVVGYTGTASNDYPGLAAVFPLDGGDHGFSGTVTGLSAGTHTVCVTAINVSFGADTSLGCKTVVPFTGSPIGVVDAATAVPGAITIAGWMLDPDSLNPITVDTTLDGQPAASVTANAAKLGLGAAFPGYGDDHGYSVDFTGLSGGSHVVCVSGVNVGAGSNSSPICNTVAIPTGNPVGVIDTTSTLPNEITVSGWMLDPDTISPIQVQAIVDGVLTSTVTASSAKTGLDDAFPGYGDNHGYTVNLTALAGGAHTVCIVGVNVGAGSNSAKICRVVTIPTGPPTGVIDSTSTEPNTITVNGWMLDPDTTSPIQVQVYVGGALKTTVTANVAKAGLDAAFPGFGDGHGYTATVTGSWTGAQQVCVKGLNVGPGSDSGLICSTAQMPTGPPFGVIDSTMTEPNTILLSGWMIDPDIAGPVQVQVYVGGVLQTTVTADAVKSGLGAVFPGYGDDHGYGATVTGSWTGTQQVCVVGVNVGGGTNSPQICTQAAMPTGSPFGVFDSVTGGTGTISASGWAIDPDVATPVSVYMTVDGVTAATYLANGAKSGLGGVFPGYGDNHEYSGTITGLAAGSHQLCGYVSNVGPSAPDGFIGCQTVTVS